MKNKLIVLAVMSMLGNSTANAFELKLPEFLGGKSESMPTIAVGTAPSPITTASSEAKATPQPAKITTAASVPVEVNPYTGIKATTEDNKLKIDAALVEADLYDKQFEAGKKKFLLAHKDKLYKKELSEKLSTGSVGNGSSRAFDVPDLSGFDTQRSKSLKQSKKSLSSIDIGSVQMAPPPAPPMNPQLVGIVSDGKTKTAILAMGSESATVGDGGNFAGRKVADITDTSVTLDGKKLNLVTTANTLSNPDKQDVGSGGKGTKPSGNPILSMQPQIQPADSFPMPGNMPQM